MYACLQGQLNIADILGVRLPGRIGSSQHVKLSSGYTMPLLGWGSSGAKDSEARHAVRAAIKAGFRVRHVFEFDFDIQEAPLSQCVRL